MIHSGLALRWARLPHFGGLLPTSNEHIMNMQLNYHLNQFFMFLTEKYTLSPLNNKI